MAAPPAGPAWCLPRYALRAASGTVHAHREDELAVTDARIDLKFVDADGHVLEHPNQMLEYAPEGYRDRIWHIETDDDGNEWVVWDGSRDPANYFALAGAGGMSTEEQARIAAGERKYTDLRPGAFEPAPRIADLDTERISQSVLYPTTLLGIAGVKDLDVAVAQCRAYNDWLADFCSHAPDRLFGIAIIPQQDVEAAAAEIQRASNSPNLVGTFIRPNPVVEWRHFHDPVYDPIWQAASDAAEETLATAAESPYVGADRIIWASDYPHPDAKFPGTVDELLENIGTLPAEAQQDIAWRNAQRLYQLP